MAEEFNTDLVAVKNRAQEIFAEAQNKIVSMDELSEWDSLAEIIANLSTINKMTVAAISSVEIAWDDLQEDIKGVQSGGDKLDAAVELLDEAIVLPWYLEFVDGIAIKMAIEMAMSFLNSDDKSFSVDKAKAILIGK